MLIYQPPFHIYDHNSPFYTQSDPLSSYYISLITVPFYGNMRPNQINSNQINSTAKNIAATTAERIFMSKVRTLDAQARFEMGFQMPIEEIEKRRRSSKPPPEPIPAPPHRQRKSQRVREFTPSRLSPKSNTNQGSPLMDGYQPCTSIRKDRSKHSRNISTVKSDRIWNMNSPAFISTRALPGPKQISGQS